MNKKSGFLPIVYITDSEKGPIIALITEIPTEDRLTEAGNAALVPGSLLDQWFLSKTLSWPETENTLSMS